LAGFCENTNACLGTVKEDDLFDHLTTWMTVLLSRRTWLHGVSLHMLLYHHLTPAVQRYAPQYLSFFSNCVQIFGHSIWRFSMIFIVANCFYVQRSAICVLCFCGALKCYVIFIMAFHIFVYYANQYYLSFEQSFVL